MTKVLLQTTGLSLMLVVATATVLRVTLSPKADNLPSSNPIRLVHLRLINSN